VLRNLLAGLRVLSLGRVEAGALAASQGQAVALSALLLLVACACDWARTAPPRAFDPGGLERESVGLLLALAFAWTGAREVRRPELLLPLLVARLATSVWVWLVATGALVSLERTGAAGHAWAWPLWIALFAWDVALAVRVILLLTGLGPLRSLGLGVLYAGAALYLAFSLPGEGSFWYSTALPTAAAAPAPPAPLDAEAVLSAQPERVDAALAALAPQRAGLIDVYAVVFAADARPGPHRTEAELARGVLEQRLDAAGRSLALVNHRETIDRLPLATGTNLRRAIAGIGARLDPEEDVLLVFLTGHGSQEHGVAVSFPTLPLNDVGPDALAAMLDQAGIRWRIVIVSACHSGVFVEPLRDARTLVLTAAAADRKSFGCAPDDDLTYFGRALFQEALATRRSLPAAFEDAAARLDERERRERKTPSQPQIAAGEEILARLEDLERRLAEPAPLARREPF
jgi:hypothetical protein